MRVIPATACAVASSLKAEASVRNQAFIEREIVTSSRKKVLQKKLANVDARRDYDSYKNCPADCCSPTASYKIVPKIKVLKKVMGISTTVRARASMKG